MERQLMDGVIRQRIDNGMLCVSDLMKVYEKQKGINGWTQDKRINDFFRVNSHNDRNKHSENFEYVLDILELQGVFINTSRRTFIECAENKGVITALKLINQYSTKGRGENKASYCNPYLFVALAQWLNTKFRAYVTVWITDQLILSRIEAGSEYNKLCSSIKDNMLPSLSDNGKKFIFSNVAKVVNKKIFGRHEDNLRQIASQEQLSSLKSLEIELSALIKVGYLSSYQEIKDYIEKLN